MHFNNIQHKQKGIVQIIVVILILLTALTAGSVVYYTKQIKPTPTPTPSAGSGQAPSEDEFCIQVITPARDPKTGECKDFPTPCDVPEGWEAVDSCIDETANWKIHINSKYGYQLKYPKEWSSYIPSSDQEILDSICLGKEPNKCVLNVTVLEGTSWEREQRLLGLTLSSKDGTKDTTFAGAMGLKRIGYFGETGSLYGFATIVQSNNRVYRIWAYERTEDKSDYTSEIDQILSTFKFLP